MAKLFSTEWLDELKNRCDIVDVISRYVPLKKNGREFSGCCPFHHEKTGSFFVYPESQSYHCFGCKESGDVIKFVSKYENVGFIDSVERLANIANMPLPELKDVNNNEIAKKKKEKEQILGALKSAGLYYFKNLYSNHPQAKVALNYIEKRKIKPEFVRKFGLGCSLDFDSAIRYLNGQGYSNYILKKAGLLSEVNGRIFDAFGKRLTFPIFNKEGEVIGFSARLLEDKELAKYKNTAASPVFNKSEVIFAINLLKKERELARQNNREFDGFQNIIIVEGQIDVISMHQFGFVNTVACLGTAITPMHARKLKQFSENIILLLDGDGAGQKATLRSIDVLRDSALNVKVASLPNGQDPDEFLKANGTEKMQEILNNAIDGMEYKIKVLAENYDLNDLMQKAKFVREALIVVKALKEQSEQDIYLQLVHKYCSTPVDILRLDLAKLGDSEVPFWEREQEAQPQEQTEEKEVVKKVGYVLADLFIIASLLYNKEYTHKFYNQILDLEFDDAGLNEAYLYIKNAVSNNMRPSISGLYSFMEVDSSTLLLKEAVNFEFLPDPFPEITFESYLLKNKQRKLMKESESAQALCTSAKDVEERNEAMRKFIDLSNQLNQLKIEIESCSAKYTAQVNLMNKKPRK
ncbi:MAG: DNA primase [Clostridia bacterium]|nr:DNA primase [Clostridia bacterium]